MMRLMRAVGNFVFTGDGSISGGGATCAAAPRFAGISAAPDGTDAAEKVEGEEACESPGPENGGTALP